MHKTQKQSGFTLIELMIAVAIIGILASIAIPQFHKYRKRAYLSEGDLLADSARKNILEFYAHTGRFPKNNKEGGLPAPHLIKGKHVSGITVSQGIITVSFNPVREESKGATLIFTPRMPQAEDPGPVTWERKVHSGVEENRSQ